MLSLSLAFPISRGAALRSRTEGRRPVLLTWEGQRKWQVGLAASGTPSRAPVWVSARH